MRFYSPSTRGFYSADFHAPGDIPADAVKITAKRHAELLELQAAGATIEPDAKGKPVARKPSSSRDELLELATRRVKREARRRILAIASLELQTNDNAELALAALQAAGGGITIEFEPALARRHKIDAVRDASNELELELAELDVEQLAAFVAADSPRWP